MNLTDLQKQVHATAVSKGWHESDELEWPTVARLMPKWFRTMLFDPRPTARQKLAWLALVTDELDEAAQETEFEYYVDSKPCGILSEYADAVIRIFDMAEACGWHDIGSSFIPVEVPSVSVARNGFMDAVRAGRNYAPAQLAVLLAAIMKEFVSLRCGVPACLVSTSELFRMIEIKNDYNRTRSHRHGGKLA